MTPEANTETVTVIPKGKGFEVTVKHDQSGFLFTVTLSKNAYEQFRQHFLGNTITTPSAVAKQPEPKPKAAVVPLHVLLLCKDEDSARQVDVDSDIVLSRIYNSGQYPIKHYHDWWQQAFNRAKAIPAAAYAFLPAGMDWNIQDMMWTVDQMPYAGAWAINPINDGRPFIWQPYEPSPASFNDSLQRINFMTEAVVLNHAAMVALEWRMPKVSETWHKPGASSGIGHFLSKTMNEKGFPIYRPAETLNKPHVPRVQRPLEPVINVRPAIVTGMWQRPEIFEIFAAHTATLGVDVIVAGSEGAESRKRAEKYGFKYIEIANDPLASKMNATTLKALEDGYTHVICLGSDDLISKDLLDEYFRLMRAGYDFIAVLDWYFYDTTTGKSSYWGGYIDRQRIGHTCGAGRVISANLLRDCGGKPWEIKHSSVLDSSMQEKLRTTDRNINIFSLKDKGLFAVDVKSSTNMTPFDLWPNTSLIDSKIITSRFNVRDSVGIR